MIDGRWVVALECEITSSIESRAGGVRDLAHALLDHVEHFERESPDCSAQLAGIRHYICGFTTRIIVTEITPASIGRLLREMMV